MSVVPDAIEPIIAMRAWGLDSSGLRSTNQPAVWQSKEALEAYCTNRNQPWGWQLESEGGMTLKKARKFAKEMQRWYHNSNQWQSVSGGGMVWTPDVPALHPPPGMGWVFQQLAHDAPFENCTCGIYAIKQGQENALPCANVYGTVKLWGTIIPAEFGYRAQFAYPDSFTVYDHDLSENEQLRAFGVPIRCLCESCKLEGDHDPFAGRPTSPYSAIARSMLSMQRAFPSALVYPPSPSTSQPRP